ncbi:MAG: glycosyl transferase [Ilumatobacteraceae bacterium]|nr:glycosyl transferase [Ilumatobacteraceae bacterium]
MANRISFAIPYFHNITYLLEAIDSVRAQTVTDWDLVVVDDAGPEPAEAEVMSIGDPRITYVRNPTNLGLARNWNECIRRSTAPLVTVLHADDRLLPTYAERVLTAARLHPDVAAVFTDVEIIGSDGEPTITIPDLAKRIPRRLARDHDITGDRGVAGLLVGNYILCPTLCMRPAIVGQAPFDPAWRFVPDLDFTIRQLFAGRSLHSIREPLLQYRRHETSQTSALTEDASRFEEELRFSREAAARAAGLGWHRAARAGRLRVLARVHLLLRAGTDLVGGRRAGARQKWRILRGDLRRGQRIGAEDAHPQQ